MLTAGGQSPLCENHRSEVEMEDTGAGGAGTRATCHVPGSGGHGSLGSWAGLELGWGWAARGQFVTNNTKYRQVHPLLLLLLPSWGNVLVCWEILLLKRREAQLLNI